MTPEELSRLHEAAFPEDRSWSAAEFEALLAQKSVALIAGHKSFLLLRAAAGEAEILTLAVDPAARRQGIARGLLARAEAQDPDIAEIFLEVAADNHPAIALYKTSGYRQTGRRPFYYARKSGEPVAALVFAKALAKS